jgi:hypothetical protein
MDYQRNRPPAHGHFMTKKRGFVTETAFEFLLFILSPSFGRRLKLNPKV